MTSIFLSVLTKVPDEYKDGYKNFLNLLKLQNLEPRTLGTTDFANKTPLDEVIELMYQCEGTIILGFPQMIVKEAELNGEKVKGDLHLATEWNHIEGSIAIAIGLPLLVIVDSTVSTGIFDKGVLNSFVYRKNLLEPTWSSSNEIAGAMTKWKTLLKQITKPNVNKRGSEKPKVKYGCFTFPPDETLYCPYCYNKEAEKYIATRVNIKNYQCTNCGRSIPTG